MNEPNGEAERLLRMMPLFADLNEEEMKGLCNIAILRSYRKKSIIFSEGSEKEAVYFIRDGLIKTYKTDENGNEHIVSFLKKGDMFPHTGLFHPNPYPATAEAIVPASLLAMPIKPFENLLATTPAIAIKLMRVMTGKILELQNKLQELTGHHVQNRGQLFLLKLAEDYGMEKNGKLYIDIPMTHQDIANAIGTTRETVNRMLNQWRKEELVETSRSGFIIYDLEAFKRWKEQ